MASPEQSEMKNQRTQKPFSCQEKKVPGPGKTGKIPASGIEMQRHMKQSAG